MNAPLEHTKRLRVVALDGIYELDATGHYQRVELFEEEPSYPFAGLIIIALSLIGWGAFLGMGYAAYRAVEAFAGA